MKTKRKLYKIIPFIVLIAIVSVLAIFSSFIDKRAYKMFYNNFDVAFVKNQLAVHFVDVGQGDGIAVNLPNGKVLLIDSGPASSSNSLKKYIKNNVISGKINGKVDYLVLTHADRDHVGGTLTLLKSFDVEQVFLPSVHDNTKTFNSILDYIADNNINSTTDYELLEQLESDIDVFTLGEMFADKTNENCPLVKIECFGYSFLLTGDIPSEVEHEFVVRFGDQLDSDVLKVGHHGSKNSSSNEFLQVVSPAYAVISSGNVYGHPHQEALDRLKAANATILRTDELGNITFIVGDKYGFSYITGDYKIFNFSFKFLYLALIVDGILIVSMTIVLIVKPKNKRKKG